MARRFLIGSGILCQQGQYFSGRIHHHDPLQPATTAFTCLDGMMVSFARRLSARVFFYQQAGRSVQTSHWLCLRSTAWTDRRSEADGVSVSCRTSP